MTSNNEFSKEQKRGLVIAFIGADLFLNEGKITIKTLDSIIIPSLNKALTENDDK